MKLIAGLGNPGKTYINSRHNVGFLVVRALSESLKAPLKKEKGIPALSGKARISGDAVILAMPLSFMNLSGEPIRALIKRYEIQPHDLLVVCDDMDLEFGRLRIRPAGSSGGHRGLKSIIGNLDSEDFARLRVGIGRPGEDTQAQDYVLSNFLRREEKSLKDAIDRAGDCCRVWATEGVSKAMNMFNWRIKDDE